MVFHWSLSDSKSLHVSRTLLSILAVLNNAVVWMVSTRPPTSKSSSPFSNPLVTVPNAPITIGIIVTRMFYSFFNSLSRSTYFCFFSLSFSFILWLSGVAKSTILHVLFFLLITKRSGLLAEIRRSVCMQNFLHISRWITLPTQLCLALYPSVLICSIRLLRLMVSSLSPHSLHLLFYWVLSILALIWLVLRALSFAAFGRDSVSLLKFPFLSHVQVLSCEILFISHLNGP